jgi:hypothetical protein
MSDPLPPHHPSAPPHNLLLRIIPKPPRSPPSSYLPRKSTVFLTLMGHLPGDVLPRRRVCQVPSWQGKHKRVLAAFDARAI